MDKFLQQFKDNLDNQPLPNFEANDWQKMQQKLEAQPTPFSPTKKYFFWTIAMVLFISLLSNFLIFNELRKANETIGQLESRVDSVFIHKNMINSNLKNLFPENNEKEDLTASKNEINVENPQYPDFPPKGAGKSGMSSTAGPIDSQTNITDLLAPLGENRGTSLSQKKSAQNFKNKTSFPNEKILSNNSEPQNNTRTNSPFRGLGGKNQIQKLPSKFNQINVELEPDFPKSTTEFVVQESNKKSLRQFLYPFLPKSLEVGAQFGRTYTFNNQNELNFWNYGINTNIIFSEQLQMWLGAQNLSMKLEVDDLEEYSGIPTIEPPSDDFTLEEAKVNRQGLQFDIGMQYFFRSDKKLQPFAGIGFGLAHIFKNNVKYEFESATTTEEAEISQDFGKINRNFAVGKAGIAYQIFSKWSVRLEGVYRYNLSENEEILSNNLSMQLGIFYKF